MSDGAEFYQQQQLQEHEFWLFEQEYLLEQANVELSLIIKETNHE